MSGPRFDIARVEIGGQSFPVQFRPIPGGVLAYAQTPGGQYPLAEIRYRRKPLIHNGRKPR